MKKLLVLAFPFMLLASSCETANQILGGINNQNLSSAEIAAGLKEALSVGAQNSSNKLSMVDGFFANAAIKILMPEEARRVESTLRSIGMGNLVDKAVLSMNRAAEDAAKFAANIFIDAIRQMTIQDALGILQGGDFAATNYFKHRTTTALLNAFRPTIESALARVNATKYWNDVMTMYNSVSTNKINPDLSAFVTQKAVDGIFYQIGFEEQRIRQDPAARVSDILRKVFGSQLAQGRS